MPLESRKADICRGEGSREMEGAEGRSGVRAQKVQVLLWVWERACTSVGQHSVFIPHLPSIDGLTLNLENSLLKLSSVLSTRCLPA